jgi:glycosyltransferase involved in cell wall biosynthesis
VAVLTVRNEERFIGACVEHLIRQGVEVYICDNGSTDRTVEIAEPYCGAGVIAIERVPYGGDFQWERLLRRKEELFQSLDAEWLIHVDADEILLSPSDVPLARAIADVDALGYDTIEFNEFTFVPTLEAPDHDTPEFLSTLRTYYPFRPRSPHCVRALKKQDGPMEIAWSGGHNVRFAHTPALYPTPFRMKHYLFLSVDHAKRKYVTRPYRADLRARGWHGWRARLRPEDIRLPAGGDLRVTASDQDLDPSNPWTTHWLEQCVGS